MIKRVVLSTSGSTSIERATLLTSTERDLLRKLVIANNTIVKSWVLIVSDSAPALERIGIINNDYTMTASDMNKTKQYLESQGMNFEQVMASELSKTGVKVTSTADVAAAVTDALNTGGNISQGLEAIINKTNLGAMTDVVKNTLLNSGNAAFVKQAVDYLGYPIPTTTDATGAKKLKQLYWGVYYLKNYPIPNISSTDCTQIDETIVQLQAEKANLKQSELDKLYGTYTAEDLNMREQAVADLITKFQGLSGQLKCTSSRVASSNAIVKYSVYGLIAVVAIVVVIKIMKHKNQAAA
jgi:hypothetical protein